MKSIIITIVCALTLTVGYSQNISKEGGFFVDENGKKHNGELVSYYEDGTKEAIYEVKNGKENGKVEFFYPATNKLMEQGFYKNGEKDATWIKWSENGKKLAEANYKDGEKDGKWIIWDENGIVRYEMEYTGGQRTGSWINRDEGGTVIKTKNYNQ
ncbi:MAG: hypothetical protein KDD29_01220 [Flavobacteriales bacterium]|nr:hypothetical protein [Flavobacteriales bacterium]MCB9336040.1 toxin-antitoxin system YwqK family antitoxin [Flavobacteriales bacterium]